MVLSLHCLSLLFYLIRSARQSTRSISQTLWSGAVADPLGKWRKSPKATMALAMCDLLQT